MKLRLFIMALVYAAAQSAAAYASAPEWQVDWTYNQERPSWQAPNASDYENFTVMVVKIEEALQPYASKDDMLALFVGDELRGLAKPASVVGSNATDATSFVLKAFGNEADGDLLNVTLKYYNARLKHLFSRTSTIVFSADNVLGIDEDFIPAFTLGSSKYPVVKTIDVSTAISSTGITPAEGDVVAAFVGDECRGVLTLPLKDGELLNVFLREDGETVTLKYYDADSQQVMPLSEGGEEVVVKGDANGDGIVDVSDYIGIANYIMGNIPAGFNEQAADVNGDGVIDVSDYIGVANIILTGSPYGN
jgi:hypothetical protein